MNLSNPSAAVQINSGSETATVTIIDNNVDAPPVPALSIWALLVAAALFVIVGTVRVARGR